MSNRSRPLLSVRLIGPAEAVTAHRSAITAHLAAVYGDRIVCRSSTRHGGYTGELRAYLTITEKENP